MLFHRRIWRSQVIEVLFEVASYRVTGRVVDFNTEIKFIEYTERSPLHGRHFVCIYHAELLVGRLCDSSSILAHVKLTYIPDTFYLQW